MKIGRFSKRAVEEVPIWIDGSWEALSEPVEGDISEYRIERRIVVCPFEHFFADPRVANVSVVCAISEEK